MKSETKHTPIPWKFDPYWSLIMAGKTEIAAVHAAITAGELAKRKRLDEAHANAKFICRAVNSHTDLLAALKLIADAETHVISGAHGQLEAVVAVARKAIQKTEAQS